MSTHLCVDRKYELYSMDWDLKEELRDCLVAAAPYGGPIGMLPLPHCMLWNPGMNLIPEGIAVRWFFANSLLRCF